MQNELARLLGSSVDLISRRASEASGKTSRTIPGTRKSKLLRDTGLPKHRVGGVPGQDLPVYRKTTWVIGLREESPSRPGCNWPSEDQDVTIFVLVQYVETRGPVAGDTVQLEQLGDKGFQLLNQDIR